MPEQRSSAAIAAEIEKARRDARDATGELDAMRAARPGLLLSASDDALEAHDRAMSRASRQIERAAAIEADLGPKLKQTEAGEEQARRREVYERGLSAAEEYRRLVKTYEAGARKVAATLKAMAGACNVVELANEALPIGAGPIDADAFRHPPHDPGVRPPREIEVDVWVDPQGNAVKPAYVGGGRSAQIQWADSRQVKRIVPNPAHAAWTPNPIRHASPITANACLPAVGYAEPDIWSAR